MRNLREAGLKTARLRRAHKSVTSRSGEADDSCRVKTL
jgi:hypothetical protein